MNIAQQIVNGLVLGSGYACIALGWTILLGVARLVNFAHGQILHARRVRHLVCDDQIGHAVPARDCCGDCRARACWAH